MRTAIENKEETNCSFCKVPLEEIKMTNGSWRQLVCNDINCPRFRQPQGIRKIYFGRETEKEQN